MIGISEFLVMLGAISSALVLWIAVIIFAAVMLRRGGGRAERFLVAGAGLKLVSSLLTAPAAFMMPWLMQRGYSIPDAKSIIFGYGTFCKVVGMAGIICLVCAFWIKFKMQNSVGEVPLPEN